jgi:hypothetical protein
MKYYTFRQNNPRGRWQANAPLILSIQAESLAHAQIIGEKVTDNNMDYCACCGGYRWDWSRPDDVADEPTYRDKALTSSLSKAELYDGYEYASGRVSHDFWVVDSQGCIKLKVSYSRGEVATLD